VDAPTFPSSNIPFSTESNFNGVCKVLGFDYHAPGALTYSQASSESMLIIDYNGKILKGSNNGYKIGSIVCVNK
jgi:hypothetical protein